MKSGIYKITNRISGRVYIGSSIDTKTRMRKHKEKLNRNEHPNQALQNAWNRYGQDAFEFSLLLICSPENLIFYEQRAIDAFNSTKKSFGYNIRKIAQSNFGLPSKKRIIKSSDKYGRLTFIRQTKIGSRNWIMSCDCGKIITARCDAVKSGNTNSCGCFAIDAMRQRRMPIAGTKYNLLTLIEPRGIIGQLAAWLCKCDCGNEYIGTFSHIKRGHVKSCGCLKKIALEKYNDSRRSA